MDALRIFFLYKTLAKKNIDCYYKGGRPVELELSQTNLIHKMLSFVLFCTNLFPIGLAMANNNIINNS